MNCKQTTPSTGTDKKAFKPWCGSCALKQEDRILGSFETLPAIDKRIELCFLEKQLDALQQVYEEKARIYLRETEPTPPSENRLMEEELECSVEHLVKKLQAQGLDIGLHAFYAWLRKKDYIRYQKNRKLTQVPTQKALDEIIMLDEDRIRITLFGQLLFAKMLFEEHGMDPKAVRL